MCTLTGARGPEGGPEPGSHVRIKHLNSNDFAVLMKNPPPGAHGFFIGDQLGGSGWEIAIKVSIGKLAALPGLPAVLAEAGVRRLGIEDEHLRRLESLPWHHRDPFDRLLIAQAQAEALTVLTADPAFGDYAVPARDARR